MKYRDIQEERDTQIMGELDKMRQTERTTDSEMRETDRKNEKDRQIETDPYHNELLGVLLHTPDTPLSCYSGHLNSL